MQTKTSALTRGRTLYLVLALSFIIGGSIGGAWETAWAFIRGRGLVWTSGLVLFPLCNPIYGLGAMLSAFHALREEGRLRRFTFSFISLSLLEYVMSVLEEAFLGTRSWDYSAMPFNLNGRVNLLYCLFFAFLGLFFSEAILPRIRRTVDRHVDDLTAPCLLFALVYALCAMLILTLLSSGQAGQVVDLFYQRIGKRNPSSSGWRWIAEVLVKSSQYDIMNYGRIGTHRKEQGNQGARQGDPCPPRLDAPRCH